MRTEQDTVTGLVAEVEYVTDVPPDRMWDLVTAVERIGEWSPEMQGAAWRDGAGPRVGAVFDGHLDFHDDQDVHTECVVTEATRPGVFEWVVLDDAADPARPGSYWRYELSPAGTGTRVVHRFTHGPGDTGLREGVRENPDRAEAVIRGRLDQLRANMTSTLNAMTGGAR